MLYDVEAKKRLGYKHPRSKVRLDGSEVLVGNDWQIRKRQLWDQASGRCEAITSDGERCRSEGHDPHHIVPRGKRRDDRLINLRLVCRMHHQLLDRRKLMWSKP